MSITTEKKFNIYTAFSFMVNGLHDEKSQMSYLIDIAKGMIEAAQARTDTPYKTIGARLFFYKLEEFAKNILHSEHSSISTIDEEDLIIEIKNDDREMFVIEPVVFPALFLIIYYFRWKMIDFYNEQLKKKITFVISENDLIIQFYAQEGDGTYLDFRGDITPEYWITLNDFLAGKVDNSTGLSKHFEVLRLINVSQQYTADLFENHAAIFGKRKPVDPFVSFCIDAECMFFKIENALRVE